MSLTPHELVRHWFEEVWNQGKEEAVDHLMAPQAEAHHLPSPQGQSFRGLLRKAPGSRRDL